MKKVIGLWVMFALCGLSPAAFGVPLNIDSVNCTTGASSDIVSTADVTGNQGGSSECFGTLPNNDPGPSGDGLEIDGMVFEFISKVDEENGSLVHSGADIGLSITGDGGLPASFGTWSYDSSLFAADAFVIVIKAANTPGWAAWLFEGPDAASDAGDWLIAWVANGGSCTGFEPTGNCADISHFGIYAKNARVPEPGTIALFGLGLIGFGLARRRKIK